MRPHFDLIEYLTDTIVMADIVIIGGCGHVGLPLGLAFARAAKSVVAFDTSRERVNLTKSGRMPFRDQGADELLPRVLADGSFRCTTERQAISDAETVISVIGTPVDEHLNPRFDLMQDFIAEHRPLFRPGQLFILRSTVYPGTTDRVHAMLQKEGLDLDVAFCPERVAQGFSLEEITTLPQIVGGCTERAQRRAEALFRLLTPQIVPTRPLAAELTKLFNNAWRYIQFAVANQFFMIANDHGIDFYDIYHAMTDNYPRAKGFPGAGFASGPCLFKDTLQLSAFHNNSFFLGHAAMLVNEGLPNYIVRKAAGRHNLKELTAGILGMTFKPNCDDPRDSLSFTLRKILQAECPRVLCADPYLNEPWISSIEETLKTSQVLFIGVPHREYLNLDFGRTPVYDIWNVSPSRVRVL